MNRLAFSPLVPLLSRPPWSPIAWNGVQDVDIIMAAGEHVKREGKSNKISRVLAALRPYDPDRVYVFGSWALGEQDELSDLDLVVIKRTVLPFFDRIREVLRLLPGGIGPVDVLVYTPEEFEAMLREGNAFAELIAEEGRLIHGGQAEG